MKRITRLFSIALLSGVILFSGCSDDDDPTPLPEVAIADGSKNTSMTVSRSSTLSATLKVAGKIKDITATSSLGNQITVTNAADLKGKTEGTVTITYVATNTGDDTVKLTVTDEGNQTMTASFVVKVLAAGEIGVTFPTGDALKFTRDVQKDILVDLVVPEKVKTIAVASKLNATVSVSNANELAGKANGKATVSYQSATDGKDELTVTVTDETGQQKVATVMLKVNKPVVSVATGNMAGYNWVNTNDYLLDGYVVVPAGQTLTVQKGTTVRFKESPTTGDNTSALFITRGAKIMAEGTKEMPIVFTAESDDLEGSLDHNNRSLWGGLVLLGKAKVEKKSASEVQIEGIPSDKAWGKYGGDDDMDNSGSLKYVSIKHSGVGFKAGDELQGLTLGGVGSGTTIDYIDIFASADDGIEIFGGKVNIKHVSVAFATDDSFDFDLGWRGNGQFLFALQDGTNGDTYDHAGEWDGASPDDAALYSKPNIYNATFVGVGQTLPTEGRNKAFIMRENYAGLLANSIIVDFPGKGLEVQDLTSGEGNPLSDSYKKMNDGELRIYNNTWSAFADATDLASLVKVTTKNGKDKAQTPDDADGSDLKAHLSDNGNKYASEVVVKGIGRDTSGALDPRPKSNDDDVYKTDLPAGIMPVDYRGAFDASAESWLSGWSTLAKMGYLAQ
ncbi:hypothetical protein FUAX_02980 [Fulvitalea axinellae]|uniref:Uncharacterized protein n=1 Tax=Fulvitalea axinellae TaxID=1182444 RepID=A0AAU9C727_9BACT|nr:hypothetical protein FUAX_02980 [Fulvitalea axinellae]